MALLFKPQEKQTREGKGHKMREHTGRGEPVESRKTRHCSCGREGAKGCIAGLGRARV